MSGRRSLCHDDRGATAIQYGLMAALLAVAIMVTIASLGDEMNDIFVKAYCGVLEPGRSDERCPTP